MRVCPETTTREYFFGQLLFNFRLKDYLCHMIYPINRKAMEKKEVRKVEVKVETRKQEPKRKVSKTWEAAQRLKGTVIVNDPTLFWR